MDVDKSVLTRLFVDGDITDLMTANVSEQIFSEVYQPIYSWAVAYYNDHHTTPRHDAVKAAFPGFTFSQCTEPLTFYIEELKRKFVHSTVRAAMIDAATHLKSTDLGAELEALQALERGVFAGRMVQKKQRSQNWSRTARERFEAYQQRKLTEGIEGVTFGFSTLDGAVKGLKQGQLVYIIAPSGLGKTWMLCYMGLRCLYYEWSPVFFTHEMAIEEIGTRLDALHFSLDPDKIRSGSLRSSEEIRWQEELAELENLPDFFIEERAGGTVAGVRATRRQYPQAKALLIDGGYMLTDKRNARQDWQRLMNISEELAITAKEENVLVVVTLQLTDQGTIQRSKGMKNDAHLIVHVKQDHDDSERDVVKLEMDKHRGGKMLKKPIPVLFDLDNAEIRELDEDEEVGAMLDSDEPLPTLNQEILDF